MKKLMIGLFVVSFLGFAAIAANGPDKPRKSPDERAAAMTERLDKIVGLNDDQKSKVAGINTESAQRMEMLRQQMKEVRENRESGIMEVLTPEQREKFAQHKEEMKQKFQDRKKGHKDGKGRKDNK